MSTRILSFCTFLFLLAGLFLSTPTAQAKDGDLRIPLAPAAGVTGIKGKAKYAERRAEREFQVELEASLRLAGTTFVVAVDNVVAGEITLDALGRGRLNLNTIRRQVVPAVRIGSEVKVLTTDSKLVLSGKF